MIKAQPCISIKTEKGYRSESPMAGISLVIFHLSEILYGRFWPEDLYVEDLIPKNTLF